MGNVLARQPADTQPTEHRTATARVVATTSQRAWPRWHARAMSTHRDVSLLVEAGLFFERALSNVAADEWGLPTPCADWDVAELVDHVVGGNRWAALVLNGVGGEEALAAVRASEFGRDRVSEHASSSSGQSAAFSAEGAWIGPSSTWYGP